LLTPDAVMGAFRRAALTPAHHREATE
jgi:hypothetical protein